MVGISATFCPALRQSDTARRSSAILRATAIIFSRPPQPPSCVFSWPEAIRQRAGNAAHQPEIEFGPVGDIGAEIIERAGMRAGAGGHRVQQGGRELRLAENTGPARGLDLGADFLDSPGAGLAVRIDRAPAHRGKLV